MSRNEPDDYLGEAPIYWYYPTGDADKAEDIDWTTARDVVWLQGEEVIASATLGPRMPVREYEPLLWEGDDA